MFLLYPPPPPPTSTTVLETNIHSQQTPKVWPHILITKVLQNAIHMLRYVTTIKFQAHTNLTLISSTAITLKPNWSSAKGCAHIILCY